MTQAERRKKRQRENFKAWAERNQEHIREKNEENYHAHREERLTKTREWMKKNRDRWNAYLREYRRKRRAAMKIQALCP